MQCVFAYFFFSSGMADVALWLGPYMSISSQNDICTRTQKVQKCRQITTNQKKNHTRHQDDPQIPQPDLRFVKNKNSKPDTQRGKMQKVPQPSKPTWVSVQDVVLNSLRPSTQPSQLLPELSHFYQTHKHRKMSCSCRYGSCWCVTP